MLALAIRQFSQYCLLNATGVHRRIRFAGLARSDSPGRRSVRGADRGGHCRIERPAGRPGQCLHHARSASAKRSGHRSNGRADRGAGRTGQDLLSGHRKGTAGRSPCPPDAREALERRAATGGRHRMRRPPRIATWLLQRLGSGPDREALAGDLIEQYQRGRSAAWYYAQAVWAVVAGAAYDARHHYVLAIRAVVIWYVLAW